jgi:hypothetical protein
MRKITFLLIAFLVLSSCGVKTAQSQLSSGDYDQAIETATENLRNNKDKKRKQDYIYMLEEAFAKAKQRDMANIELWAKETSPSNFEKIYDAYVQLNNRQEKIRPLLPLKLIKENRNAIFPFENYSDEIVSSKNALSKYLYDNAAKLVKSGNKMDSRKAYDDLIYLESITPDFKDTKKLMEEARFKGTDFVSMYTKNETNIMIPVRLENDLLDFSTFGLNDKWTVYHGNRQKNIEYDYGVIVNFRDIKISPEQVKEKEFTREKEIKDGKKKLLDRNGNVVLDSLGHPVMVDKIRTVRIKVNEFRQFKACQVGAKVDYIDFRNNQLIESFPLASEFIFENIYAKFRGDKRAIDEGYLENFDRHPLPFPSNEQMVYDSGEDLKAKLKTIISKHHFRR